MCWFLLYYVWNVFYFLNDLGDEFFEDIIERVGLVGMVMYVVF